jgi:hypothetical protein
MPPWKGKTMIVLAAMVFGALTGTGVARRRGGRGLDQLQYAAGYGIAFAILGVFATIFIDRMT